MQTIAANGALIPVLRRPTLLHPLGSHGVAARACQCVICTFNDCSAVPFEKSLKSTEPLRGIVLAKHNPSEDQTPRP
jgi:hypothetical protein